VCDDDDPVGIETSFALASALRNQWRFEESEMLFRRCHVKTVRILGREHEISLTYANGLATCFIYQGKHDDALAVLQPLLDVNKRVTGAESMNTLMCAIEIAKSLTCLRRLDQAESMYKEYVPIFKRVLGPTNSMTLRMLSDYGCCIALCGRLAEGEAMLVEALAVEMRVLGAEHAITRATTRDLADMRKFSQIGLSPARIDPRNTTKKDNKKKKK